MVRRIRGALAVYGALYDASAAAALRADLKEWGSALGVARDYQVRTVQLEKLLEETDVADARPRSSDVSSTPSARQPNKR